MGGQLRRHGFPGIPFFLWKGGQIFCAFFPVRGALARFPGFSVPLQRFVPPVAALSAPVARWFAVIPSAAFAVQLLIAAIVSVSLLSASWLQYCSARCRCWPS